MWAQGCEVRTLPLHYQQNRGGMQKPMYRLEVPAKNLADHLALSRFALSSTEDDIHVLTHYPV
jgi:hypothetical protein